MFKAYLARTPSDYQKEYNWRTWCANMMNMMGKDIDDLKTEEAERFDLFCKKKQLQIHKILDRTTPPDVRIIQSPDLRVAYIRNMGMNRQDEINTSYSQLFQWAYSKNLFLQGFMLLCVIWNYAPLLENAIFDACITVPESLPDDQWVSIQNVPGGAYAFHHAEVDPNGIEELWLNIVLNWLVPSSYQIDNRRPKFFRVYTSPEMHPFKHTVIDFYVPIKSLYEQ